MVPEDRPLRLPLHRLWLIADLLRRASDISIFRVHVSRVIRGNCQLLSSSRSLRVR